MVDILRCILKLVDSIHEDVVLVELLNKEIDLATKYSYCQCKRRVEDVGSIHKISGIMLVENKVNLW